MAETITPVGWTDGRIRRSWTFIGLLTAAAALALAAMVMPWVSMSFGSQGDDCVIGDTSHAVPMYDNAGQSTPVAAAGCISAYQSVHLDSYLGSSGTASGLKAPMGAPVAGSKFGMPSATFWLVAAAGVGAIALIVRNALLLLPALLMLRTANGAFGTHRKVLSWGLEGMSHEMYGVKMHQYALVAIAVALIVSAVFLLKVNAEQRKVELAEFQEGKRDKPPTMVTAQLIAAQLVRGNLEKLSEAAAAAKETAKAR